MAHPQHPAEPPLRYRWHVYPNPRRFPKNWWHWWRLPVIVVLVAACTGGIVFVQERQSLLRTYCGAGVVRMGNECVGTTDGSFVFDPALATVESAIKRENDRIGSVPSVTVALLLPMTTTTDLLSEEQIKSNVEGAYTAQYASNNSSAQLKIRLVLANEGSQEQAWQKVTDQLGDMVHDSSSPLVAVTGLGVSATATAEVEKALSSKRIPMIGSEYTADNLNTTGIAAPAGGNVNGLTRVIPTNLDEVQALGRVLGPQPAAAMLVNDNNPDDLYPATLANDFRTVPETMAAWKSSGSLTAPYDAEPGTTSSDAEFRNIASRLCDQNAAKLVFYAGRGSLLPDFLNRLSMQGCQQKGLTVVTGSDATSAQNLVPTTTRTAAGVTLVYAAPNDPAALHGQSSPDYLPFAQDFLSQHFDQLDLDSGWAVPGHDAMLTAIQAIQNTVGPHNPRPTPQDVTGALEAFNAKENPVHGASGTFWFDGTTGNRVSDQPIPVLKLTPNATQPTIFTP